MGTADMKFKCPGVPETADTPGHNEWGVPRHAQNGYIQDAHYWSRLRYLNQKREHDGVTNSTTDAQASG